MFSFFWYQNVQQFEWKYKKIIVKYQAENLIGFDGVGIGRQQGKGKGRIL